MKLFHTKLQELQDKCDYTVSLAGNPNVGKSTVFNSLTGMHQHTGNWPGKTVANASGICRHEKKDFLLVDLPGTYSIMSNSQEEEIARDYICFGNPDCTIIVVDATCLERNLNLVFQILEITNNVVICVNLLDEAEKKGIEINLKKLEEFLGVPVVGTIARKKKTLKQLMDAALIVCTQKVINKPKEIQYADCIENAINKISEKLPKILDLNTRWVSIKLLDENPKLINTIEEKYSVNLHSKKIKATLQEVKKDLEENNLHTCELKDKLVSTIMFHSENICNDVVSYKRTMYSTADRKIDKILTSKKFGIPIMILLLGFIFWLTITGANYPSQMLAHLFAIGQEKLSILFEYLNSPVWLTQIIVLGMYKTLAWVVSVMLPPMAIFFPLFTILEDLGYLPRIAFNLDNFFRKSCTTGKQALTMWIGEIRLFSGMLFYVISIFAKIYSYYINSYEFILLHLYHYSLCS